MPSQHAADDTGPDARDVLAPVYALMSPAEKLEQMPAVTVAAAR